MLNDLANILSIVQTILLFVSIYFIWRELKENNRLARAANNQSLVELSSPFNLQLIQDRKIAEFWVSGAKDFEKMDQVDKYRYDSLLVWWLILHENIYYQHKRALLDQSTYAAWAHDLEHFVRNQRLWLRWTDIRGSFQLDFENHISQIIEKQKTLTAVKQPV